MLYFGKRYSLEAAAGVVLPFWCQHCGHRASCDVTGVGEGRGHSVYLLDDEGAAERAVERASDNALADAQYKLGLASCPGCGRRNRVAVASHWLGGLLKASAAIIVFGGIAIFLGQDSPTLMAVFAVLGLVAACALFANCVAKNRQAVSHVEFLPAPPPSPAPPPRPRRRKASASDSPERRGRGRPRAT